MCVHVEIFALALKLSWIMKKKLLFYKSYTHTHTHTHARVHALVLKCTYNGSISVS